MHITTSSGMNISELVLFSRLFQVYIPRALTGFNSGGAKCMRKNLIGRIWMMKQLTGIYHFFPMLAATINSVTQKINILS